MGCFVVEWGLEVERSYGRSNKEAVENEGKNSVVEHFLGVILSV